MHSARKDAEGNFSKDIAEHEMKVLKDEGVYRHLVFRRPNTRTMSFEIITWPGHLVYTGDMGCYVFSRVTDMLEFFRGERSNPGYWSEKVLAQDVPSGVWEFSAAKARAWVQERMEDGNADVYTRAEAEELNYDDGDVELRRSIDAIGWSGFDALWEVSFRDFTYRFTWCCLALVWAVAKYDNHTTERAEIREEQERFRSSNHIALGKKAECESRAFNPDPFQGNTGLGGFALQIEK